MSNLARQQDTPRFQFCDDFGDQPLLLAHFSRDRSVIGVAGLVGGFIGLAIGGFPLVALVGFAAINDLIYAGKTGKDGTIDVDYSDLADLPDESMETIGTPVAGAIAPSQTPAAKPSQVSWNPAIDLGTNPQSCLICGVPGSGKGMLISNAIRVLKGRSPDLKVFVIDPKGDPKEAGYWHGIADTYRPYCLMDGDDPDEGADWLLSCMDEFRRLPSPKLLIFDELMAAATELELADPKMKALPRLKKFIVGLIGQGDSRDTWVWAMTQSPQVKDLGVGGGARANLRVIGLVSPKNMAAVEALVSTRLIPKPDGGMDELRAIMASSPVGRAVFDGKVARWLPMPKLENHSGYDRDSRQLVAGLNRAVGNNGKTDWTAIVRTEVNTAELDALGRKLYQASQDQTVKSAAIYARDNGQLKEAIALLYAHSETKLSVREKEIVEWVCTGILQ